MGGVRRGGRGIGRGGREGGGGGGCMGEGGTVQYTTSEYWE